MSKELELEKDLIDFVTDMMFSADFLKCISDIIFSENNYDMSIKNFYLKWKKDCGLKEDFIPMNLGVIVGYMYCGILLTKENWYNELPKTKIKLLDESYGINENTVKYPEKDVDFRYAVRRIRNALGHGNIKVVIPDDVNTKEELFEKTMFIFKDEQAETDYFEATLTVTQVLCLVKKIHSLAFSHVKSKTE